MYVMLFQAAVQKLGKTKETFHNGRMQHVISCPDPCHSSVWIT